MALDERSNDSRHEVAREFAMRDSSSSAVLLPFGSLTGIVPIDAVPRGRVLGDVSRVLGRSDGGPAEHPAASALWRVAAVEQGDRGN